MSAPARTDPTPGLPPAAPSAPAPLSSPSPLAPTEAPPSPDALPDVAAVRTALIAILADVLAAADRLERLAYRRAAAVIRRAADDLLTHLSDTTRGDLR